MENKEIAKRDIKNGIKNLIGDGTVNVFIQNRIKVEDFIFLFQKVTELAVKELSPAACKLLLYLLSRCEYQNAVRIHIQTLMEKLSLGKQTVITAMSQLVEINVVLKLKDEDDKRHNVYIINPVNAWKGRITKRVQTLNKIKAEDKRQLTLFGSKEQGIIDRHPEVEAMQKELDAI